MQEAEESGAGEPADLQLSRDNSPNGVQESIPKGSLGKALCLIEARKSEFICFTMNVSFNPPDQIVLKVPLPFLDTNQRSRLDMQQQASDCIWNEMPEPQA